MTWGDLLILAFILIGFAIGYGIALIEAWWEDRP